VEEESEMSRFLCRTLIAGLVALVLIPAVAGEGRTPIYAWQTTITQPGKYIVTRHIMPLVCAAPPIDIQTSNVDIDLNGFSVFACPGKAVVVANGQDDITIRNGTLRLADFGIQIVAGPAGNQKVVIEDVKLMDMFLGGIVLDGMTDFAIRRNQVIAAGAGDATPGIFVEGRAGDLEPVKGTIEGNQVEQTEGSGILVRNGSGVAILNNRIERIQVIYLGPAGGGIVYDISSGGLIANNTVQDIIDGSGIYLGDSTGTKIYNNVVRRAQSHGIELAGQTDDNLVLDNVVTASGQDGLRVQGRRNHIDRNLLNSNGLFGLHFLAGAAENQYGRNSGIGNTGGICSFPFTPDFCDDNGTPPGPPNWSFGDNLMPGAAGIF
jgi:hypothetical protein